MLSCCVPTPWMDPSLAYDEQVLSKIPQQQEQFVKTRGNALAGAEIHFAETKEWADRAHDE